MAHVARLMGRTAADCVAAGDSGNDRDMLGAAGAAIVVANGRDGVERLDGVIRTRARHADGVLEGLAGLGLAPGVHRSARHPREARP